MAVSPALRAAETATQKCHCFAKRIDNPVIHVGSLSAYASFALHAKDMAVSPALRATETATQKRHCFAKRIDNPVIHVDSLSA
jgi:phosphohistidine phosphatase SixA